MLAIIASIGLTILSSNGIFAGSPNDPNFAGQVTAGAAQTSVPNFGAHASDPDGNGDPSTNTAGEHGRNGLANALTGHGDPQHPSEVIGAICLAVPDAPGCP